MIKKFKVQSSKFKVSNVFLIVIFLFGIWYLSFGVPATRAADSTPSADIRSKLEELKKEIASKAAKLKQEINNKLKDKSYVGKVKSKSDSSLTLASKTGPKMISLNQDTVFESSLKSRSKFSLKTIKEEDFLAALGDIDDTGVLIARKVVLLPNPDSPVKTYLWGKIVAISDKLVTLKDKDSKNLAFSITSDSAPKLAEGNFVILTGSQGKNNIFEAGFVYVIPQGAYLKPKKIATPSAKLATPSAKGVLKKP